MEAFSIILLAVFGCLWFWALFAAPGFTIATTVIVVVVVSCISMETPEHQEMETVQENESVIEGYSKITGKLLPGWIQPNCIQAPCPPMYVGDREDSVRELCHDGITYLLVIKDGENLPGFAKENRYGDNERCAN